MDLSKYREVKTVTGAEHQEYVDLAVNKFLEEGWHILTAKIVESQFRIPDKNLPERSTLVKGPQTVFILGMPIVKNSQKPDDETKS